RRGGEAPAASGAGPIDAAHQPQSGPFLEDVPITLAGGGDAFAHSDYAGALASSLKEASTPFTVGLFGPWGVGKSSILEETKEELSGACAYAYFDAWRYEGSALRRHFLRDIA